MPQKYHLKPADPKSEKNSHVVSLFCAFGIFVQKSWSHWTLVKSTLDVIHDDKFVEGHTHDDNKWDKRSFLRREKIDTCLEHILSFYLPFSLFHTTLLTHTFSLKYTLSTTQYFLHLINILPCVSKFGPA